MTELYNTQTHIHTQIAFWHIKYTKYMSHFILMLKTTQATKR